MKGPRPKHPRLRMLEGNPSNRPIPEMPVLPQAETSAPVWLRQDERAMRFWDEHVPMLIAAELMTAADRETFAKGCEYWSLSFDRKNTFDGRLKAHLAAYRIFLEFGMTPLSRVRLAKKPLKDSPGTKWGAAL